MSHVYEQYFSPTKDAYLQDRLSESILKTIIEFAPVAIRKPDDYDAPREHSLGGQHRLNGLLSTGKVGDWATHDIEHEVSAIYDVTRTARGLPSSRPPGWITS
jgi:alcohol dehydrogenase YqhD (iron-dependent ADH family)